MPLAAAAHKAANPSQCAACTAAFERKIDEALARATGEKLADPYPQKFTKEDAATKTGIGSQYLARF